MTTAVVGAGLSGLVRALTLLEENEEVVVYEASDRPGGVVRSERRDGFLLELGPNTVRGTPEVAELVRTLGLSERVLIADRRLPRFIEFRGRLHPIAPGPGILATRLLSTPGKLRLLAEPFVRRASAERESVREFFARRLGGEVADRLIAPFVSGVWAGDASRLSIAHAFPTVARWEAEHGSLLRGAIASRRRDRPRDPGFKGLLSFPDGLQELASALAARLGERLRRRTAVRRIVPAAGLWTVEADDGTRGFERLVIASPAREAAALLREIDPDAAAALDAIPYPPLAVLHFAAPRDSASALPVGFGHLVVPEPGSRRRVLGAVWSSCLFPGRAPDGEILLTAFAGGARDPEILSATDAELARIAGSELAGSLRLRTPPRLLRATRYARALPQYDLGHGARMEALAAAEARHSGLSLLGSYRGGVSVGDVVRNARQPADRS
jgi:protoporphyrinogen/coproporphyrinogen III oxidase